MDNLFDKKITFLDIVKILLLVVTLFSTWNIVSIMTPDVPLAFIRIIAAVGVIEGAFLGFERATADAKNRKQVQLATTGFFCSLGVIALFAGISGFLEFSGDAMLAEPIGVWVGIQWTLGEAVQVFALSITVSWIVVLASIYRLYSIEDPDKQTELARIEENGKVAKEANTALRTALNKAAPTIAAGRALAAVQREFSSELTEAQMKRLLGDVETELRAQYGSRLAATPTPVYPQRPSVEHHSTPSAYIPRSTAPVKDIVTAEPDDEAPLPAIPPFLANYKSNGGGNSGPNFT